MTLYAICLKPSSPSRTWGESTCSDEGGGASSSTIVPVTVGVASCALTAALKASATVSSPSSSSSPRTVTSIVLSVSPATNASVPSPKGS